MYNQSYINDFMKENPKENIYLKYLNDPKRLEILQKQYSLKYSQEADACYLAFKESLDHYVAMRISKNKEFVNSQEFKNYAEYLKNIIQENKVQLGQEYIYLEVNTNVVFNYLDDKTLNEVYPNNLLKKYIHHNSVICERILSKMEENKLISTEELSLISVYLDNKKNFKNGEYKTFIKYVFNNLDTITTKPELVSAILTFMPNYYKEDIENSRAFLAKYDNQQKISTAHSNGVFSYTCLDYDTFHDIKLNSFNSVNKSRTFKEKDIMFLLYVGFHELSHQRQKNQARKSLNFEGIAHEINQIFRRKSNEYYKNNHDSTEIEIDADERGWQKCHWFAFEYIKSKEDVSHQCFKNAQAINCRRAFSLTEDPKTKKLHRYIDYDIKQLIIEIKKEPSILKDYPQVASVFTPTGEVRWDTLFNHVITATPAGREICNYILNTVPEKLIIERINSGKYTQQNIETLLENFVQVPHENALTLRALKKTDLNTYNETRTKYKIEQNVNQVYNYYFIECSEQLLKFSNIMEVAKAKFLAQGQSIANSYYKYFIEYYYVEMLNNIERPNMERIANQMTKFQQSNNPVLINLAQATLNHLNSNNLKNQRRSNNSMTDELGAMLNSDNQQVGNRKQAPSSKK